MLEAMLDPLCSQKCSLFSLLLPALSAASAGSLLCGLVSALTRFSSVCVCVCVCVCVAYSVV